MRKRNIKSVAHWVIMSILLLFPVLMVGISAFANDEQSVTVTETYPYETNEVNTNSDLIVGNIYHFVYNEDNALYLQNGNLYLYFSTYILKQDTNTTDYFLSFYCPSSYDDYYLALIDGNIDELYVFLDNGAVTINSNNANYDFYFVFLDLTIETDDLSFEQSLPYFIDMISASDYLGEVTTDVDIQNASYKQEVNNWANGFKNLPVNQWYGSLLNTIGVGQTDNSVMNVIYVYPLYVLWVYILDVIVDCFLVIINFGHNALHRLGGDNE